MYILWKYFSKQICWYGFHISKLNNLKIIYDSFTKPEGV
jgi:hypothetical protein